MTKEMIIELENPFEVFLFPLLKLPSHHHLFVLLAISLVPYDDDDVRLLVFCRINSLHCSHSKFKVFYHDAI